MDSSNKLSVLFLYLIVSQTVFEISGIPSYTFDREKGILLYKKGTAYAVDGYIYVPLVLTVPTKVERSLDEMFSLQSCNIVDDIQEMMDDVGKQIRERLPIALPKYVQRNIKDLIHQNGKVSVTLNENTKQLTLGGKNIQISRINPNMTRTKAVPSLSRGKRFAFIPIAIGMALAAAGGLMVMNRVDIEVQKKQEEIAASNIDTLVSYMETSRTSLNLLIDNMNRLSIITNNVTEKLNEIIEDHNCLKTSVFEKIAFLNNWSNIVPNSFLRAVNGALIGKLTVDLLPGTKLQTVMQFYPEFKDTIYIDNPSLLYNGAQVKILKLLDNPILLEVLLTIPRILREQIGTPMVMKACSWMSHKSNFTLSENPQSHLILNNGQQRSLNTCVSVQDTYLCDNKNLNPSDYDCTSMIFNKSITNCPLKVLTALPPHEVLVTEDGVVTCRSDESVTIISRDNHGVTHNRIVKTNGPQLFTIRDGEMIVVDDATYHFVDTLNPIDVSPYKFEHHDLRSSEGVRKLVMETTLTKMHPIQDLSSKIHSMPHPSHTYITYGVLVVLLLGIGVCAYIVILTKRKNKKLLGAMFLRFEKQELTEKESSTPDSIDY